MALENTYLQLFTEYEDNNIHIDVHLEIFNESNVLEVFEHYINRYSNKEINNLFIKFWDKRIAGDYLSLWRKKSSLSFLSEPLYGFRYIGVVHNYLKKYSEIGKVSLVIE